MIHDQENLTPSEMLYAFMDGELDSVQETMLFNTLATHSDLRAELRDLLAIRAAVQNDIEAFTPPVEATSAIFSGLGLGAFPPVSPALSATSVESASTFRTFLRRFRNSSLIALLLLLTWFGTSQYYTQVQAKDRAEISTLQERVNALSTLNAQAPKSIVVHDTLVQIRRVREPLSGAFLATNTSGNSPVPVAKSTENDELPQTLGVNQESDNTVLHQDIYPERTNALISQAQTQPAQPTLSPVKQIFPVFSSLQNPQDFSKSFGLAQFPNFWLQARSSVSRSYPTLAMPRQDDPLFNNMTLGAFYSLSENHVIGVEIGQERFVQVFKGKEHGYTVRYEQEPLTMWGGLAYQLRADKINILDGIQPYAQIVAGGTELGPLGKMSLGFYYSPGSRITLNGGLEGSMIVYRFQNQWFSSEKLGFTYGISLQF